MVAAGIGSVRCAGPKGPCGRPSSEARLRRPARPWPRPTRPVRAWRSWANVRTIECRFGQSWRSERGLSITMADGGEVLLRVPVDEATLTALTDCGARLERDT